MEIDATTGAGIGAVAIAAMGYMYKLAMAHKKSNGRVRSGSIPPGSTSVKVDRLREISGQLHAVDDKVDRISESQKESEVKLSKVSQEVRELHVWHNAEDENGVKKWYNKPSMERSIEESVDIAKETNAESKRQTEILRDILKETRKNSRRTSDS